MARGIIYLILNKQTGHKFVGNTILGMNKEWVHHIERSKRMSSEPLHRAFREYGVHNFMIKELDECDESEFENKTNYWIDKYKPEYNPIIETEVIEEKPKPTVKKERPKPKSSHLIAWNEKTRGNGKHFGLKIRGKNLETGLCKDYDSARIAAGEITGNPKNNSNILLAARNGRTAYGHKWQLLEDRKKSKSVFGVNRKTQQIEVRFESMAEAIRHFDSEGNYKGLMGSLKNPGKCAWRGFYWFYG